ncbi:PAS domain S-box protein [Roseateles sp. DXS20W]|uniref:histidine kinase n=1 Tax=Pelomonas lactea TaxID=3299030 RepID=A0ABW7GN94_9BURK
MLWLCWSAVLAVPPQQPAPAQIMLLASYHAGMVWSDDQAAAVSARLQDAGVPVELHRDFLDAKRVALTPAYLQAFEAMLLHKYAGHPPRLMLALDDDALDLVLRLRQRHFPGVPILFSGVAASRQAELAAAGQISGVFDDVDQAQNLRLMLSLLPQVRRVWLIHDQSRTAEVQLAGLAAMQGLPRGLEFVHLSQLSVAEIQARLRQLNTADLVLALPFNVDREGRLLSHEEAADLWAAASQAPVVVSRDVSMRPGVLGGLLMTGREQGNQLGRLAVQALQGRALEAMPMQAGRGVPTFDARQLRRWKLSDADLPAQAVLLNREPDAWTALREYGGWLASLFGSLLVIIFLLVRDLRARKRANEALSQSTSNYTALFNSSNDSILVRDGADLRLLEANPRFLSLFGYAADEVRALAPGELCSGVPPYTAGEIERRLQLAKTEGTQTFAWQSRRKDGSLFWSEVSISCYRRGEQLRLVSTTRDVTERKLLETQSQAFQNLITQMFQNLPVAVLAVDTQHRVTFWNAEMERLTGRSAEEMVGSTEVWQGVYNQPRPVLVDAVLEGWDAAALARLYTSEVHASELVPGALESEGLFAATDRRPERWLRFCAAPLRDADGRLLGGIESIIDFTRLKQAQFELEQLNEELEQRVDARSRELKLAMGQLLQSEKLAALGSLVAGVAHELNTPIGNAVSSASTLTAVARELGADLQSGAARRSEVLAKIERLREAGELTQRNAERAAKLISEFKLVAVDQTSMRRREFDLLDLARDTLAMLAPTLRGTGCRTVLDIPPGIVMDSYPGALEQIITNLAGNAVLHGFASVDAGTLRLSAHVDAETVVLQVSDDGRGMDAETSRHVFEPFFTTAMGRGGSGLGLYVVYNLATGALGGSIKLFTAPGEGSCFELRLPQRARAVPQAGMPA